MASFQQFGHLAVEECQQQSSDVRPVDICIGHDDDPVIPQFADIEIILADSGTQRSDQRRDLIGGQHSVKTRLFHVQDLSFKGEDGLVAPVARLLG